MKSEAMPKVLVPAKLLAMAKEQASRESDVSLAAIVRRALDAASQADEVPDAPAMLQTKPMPRVMVEPDRLERWKAAAGEFGLTFSDFARRALVALVRGGPG